MEISVLAVGYIAFAALIILLFSGIHIGIAMAVIGFFGMSYIVGWNSGLNLLKTVLHSQFSSYSLSVIPLFVLMGAFCFQAGLSKDLYNTVHAWLGHFRGGLAMATIGACAAFAALSGSSMATAATMGMVALPEMKRYKYSPALSAGAVCAGGTIGIMIPPSVILVIYGVITEQSIGKLFIAGFIPGIIQAILYMGVIYILCKIRPEMGPKGPSTTFKEKMSAFKDSSIVILLFVVIIGGLYFGIFSPTEAAGIGACGALIFSLVRRKLSFNNFKESLYDTISTTAMIFLIMAGAVILGYFLAITTLPSALAGAIGSLAVNRYIIIILVAVIYIFLGCLMDSMAIILLTVPIFYPMILELGFDPIWFGILVVRVTEIGLITPPVGLNIFVIRGIAKEIPMYTIFKGIVPFLIADLVHVALIIAIPQIATFLPGLMK